jgi:hypothetical protein
MGAIFEAPRSPFEASTHPLEASKCGLISRLVPTTESWLSNEKGPFLEFFMRKIWQAFSKLLEESLTRGKKRDKLPLPPENISIGENWNQHNP